MDYSPKLRAAMSEIRKIAEENDIAAFVLLHDKEGYAEFLNRVDPSYSCIRVEDGQLRVRLKTAEVGKEKAKELAEGTFNFVSHFSEMLTLHSRVWRDMKKLLQDAWGGEEGKGKITGHK